MKHFQADNNCHSDLWSEGLPYLFIRKQSIGDSSELEKSVSTCIRSNLLQVGQCKSYLQSFGLVLLSSCQLVLPCLVCLSCCRLCLALKKFLSSLESSVWDSEERDSFLLCHFSGEILSPFGANGLWRQEERGSADAVSSEPVIYRWQQMGIQSTMQHWLHKVSSEDEEWGLRMFYDHSHPRRQFLQHHKRDFVMVMPLSSPLAALIIFIICQLA